MPTRRPHHGCHGYSSSRNSVPWALASLVVQMIRVRTCPWTRMRRFPAPFSLSASYSAVRSLADCITNMCGPNLRQAQGQDVVRTNQVRLGRKHRYPCASVGQSPKMSLILCSVLSRASKPLHLDQAQLAGGEVKARDVVAQVLCGHVVHSPVDLSETSRYSAAASCQASAQS